MLLNNAVDVADHSDEDEVQGVDRRTHKRGLSPYVFVPWEHVATTYLNLPVEKMDFYVPG